MNPSRLFTFALVMIWASPLTAESTLPGSDPLGMVLQVQGEVKLQHRATTKKQAKFADFIYAGDQVTTGTGSTTLLFCPSSEIITAKQGTTLDVRAKEIQLQKGAQ